MKSEVEYLEESHYQHFRNLSQRLEEKKLNKVLWCVSQLLLLKALLWLLRVMKKEKEMEINYGVTIATVNGTPVVHVGNLW